MNSQRVLLTWGVIWLLVWLIGGMCIGPRVIPTRDAKKAHFVEALKQVSAGDMQKAEEELTKGMETEENFHNKVSAHSHALGMALLVLLLGLIQPFLGLPERVKSIFACVLVAGTILMPVGILVELANVATGTAIIIVGGALTIISVIVTLIGIIKYVSPKSESA